MTQATPPEALAPAHLKTDSSVEPICSKPNTILVIDDNAMNALMVSDILEMNGFHVRTADTSEAAIIMARILQPALVLMDINLPGMNGVAAAKILKNDPATRHIVVVGWTGEIHRGANTDFDGYITKPFQIPAMVSSIKSFLSRSAAENSYKM